MQAFFQMMWSSWLLRGCLGGSAHPFSISRIFRAMSLAGLRLRRSTYGPRDGARENAVPEAPGPDRSSLRQLNFDAMVR
jgi:hypothetical protein